MIGATLATLPLLHSDLADDLARWCRDAGARVRVEHRRGVLALVAYDTAERIARAETLIAATTPPLRGLDTLAAVLADWTAAPAAFRVLA